MILFLPIVILLLLAAALTVCAFFFFGLIRPKIHWKPGARLVLICRVISLLYILLVFGAFLWQQPWRDEKHWKNEAALKLEGPPGSRPLQGNADSWVVERLRERIEHEDTLVAVSISGGGSRSAYFAAAVLEQLSKVRMPGKSGPGSSIVNHIAMLSTVSGGSVAGAYFAANVPAGSQATDAELAAFFSRFKTAMATDFETPIAGQVWNPVLTLSYLTGQRPATEALADEFDTHLFDGRNLTFEQLFRREREQEAPLLVVNATDAKTMDLFVFTKDQNERRILIPTQRPDITLGRSTEELSTWDYRDATSMVPFESYFGDLNGFRVADAVAASAAYPLLGVIRLHRPGTPQEPTTYLADAGLFDNSGLISLFAQLLQRPLFLSGRASSKRMVVIAIDGTVRGGYEGPTGFVSGIYDLGQRNIQQLVIPEVIRRASLQDLADLLETGHHDFELPAPRAYSYLICSNSTGLPRVGTKFRLTRQDKEQIQKAAESCVLDQERNIVTQLMEGKIGHPKKYPGVLGPSDIIAWQTLFHLASQEQQWWDRCGRFAALDEIRQQKGLCYDRKRLYPVPLDFHADVDAQRSGFLFDIREHGDGLLLYATPVAYRVPGRLSLVVDLDRELLNKKGINFCMSLDSAFRGLDKKGMPANLEDPVFIPYGFHTYEMCI